MGNRKRRSVFCLIAVILLLLSGFSSYAASDSAAVQVSLIVLPFMTVELAPGSLFFTIEPDVSPGDTGTVQVEVCVNNPPTAFSIGLFSSIAGIDFSYRLLGIGGDSVPILPIVSSQNLPNLGCTDYVLELTATARPDIPFGSYEVELQLQFRIPSITRTYTLPIVAVVNPVTTAEASLATPEVAGAGGAEVPEVAIDEVYVHQQALAVSQFHLVSAEAPETPSNPVIHFPLDEGSGEYAYNAIDIQLGRGPILEGTLYQVEWIEGAMGPENQFALSLGEDGYVKIPPDPRMSFSWNQDFTLELWVRTTDSTAERTLVQRKRASDGLLYSLNLFAGVPLFYTSTTVDNYAIVKGSKNIADGVWHHIACMRENGILKLHVDGELIDRLAPETRVAGGGGGNLSSDEPSYFGGSETKEESLGGLVDASYRIGETVEFRMRITDETGAPVTDAAPTLLFIRYDYGGQQVSSGFVGRLRCNPDNEEYAYSLDTSAYEEGIYDFFLVPDDGSQQRLRVMLLEVE